MATEYKLPYTASEIDRKLNLIDEKINVSDIVDNTTSSDTNKPLSAAQGKILKGLIDAIDIPTNISDLYNDMNYVEIDDLAGFAKSSDIPTALPNPEVMTINGVSYDGSIAVNLTEQINVLIDAKLGVIENGSY